MLDTLVNTTNPDEESCMCIDITEILCVICFVFGI